MELGVQSHQWGERDESVGSERDRVTWRQHVCFSKDSCIKW